MIEIKNVSKYYSKKAKVIENLNLTINDGEIFGFLGPNGAGKTTTINMITGILEITNGEILVDGKSIITNPIEAKKRIGFVSDDPNNFLKLKGIEYLTFIADIYEINTEERVKKIEEMSKRFEMYEYLYNRIESYSHGMRQKLMIIASLIHSPQNWILDEPMVGLDPRAAYELKKEMRKKANENKCVFFSTHVLDVAEKLCDRIGIINKGNLIFVGTYEDIKNKLKENGSLEELFMEIIKND